MVEQGFLDGVKVLDLSLVGPASRATRLLADYGARVIKIMPVVSSTAQPIVPAFYAYSASRYMERIAIDLKAQEGKQVFLELARSAHVIVESFRPGVTHRLGIDFESTRAINDRIIYCSTSGYGQYGERSSWVGHDINYLATGGFLGMSQPAANGAPGMPGITIADGAAGGMQAAIAIMGALYRNSRNPIPVYLDISVTDGVLWLASLLIDEHLAISSDPHFGHDVLSGRYACYGVYQTLDNKWLAIGAIEAKFFANLCKAIGCDQWIGHQFDQASQELIKTDFENAFVAKTRQEWIELLAANETCVSPVLEIAEICNDDALQARGAFNEVLTREGEKFRQLAPLFGGMRHSVEPVSISDASEFHTHNLLAEIGMSQESIDQLIQANVVQ